MGKFHRHMKVYRLRKKMFGRQHSMIAMLMMLAIVSAADSESPANDQEGPGDKTLGMMAVDKLVSQMRNPEQRLLMIEGFIGGILFCAMLYCVGSCKKKCKSKRKSRSTSESIEPDIENGLKRKSKTAAETGVNPRVTVTCRGSAEHDTGLAAAFATFVESDSDAGDDVSSKVGSDIFNIT